MRAKRWMAGIGVVALLLGGTVLFGAESETWTGSYVWERGDGGIPGEIEAVFTPSGDNSWDILFHFDWEEEARTWEGTATGSLTSGELEGKGVEERDRKRTFVFKGTVENGVFTGEHGSIRDGEMQKLGTITLSAP